MKSNTLPQVLDLFIALQADKLEGAGPKAFNDLVSNFNDVKSTINKVKFIQNIEQALIKNNLLSITFDYDHESDDEGGSYISYNAREATFLDGTEYDEEESEVDLYEVSEDMCFELLTESDAVSIIDAGPITKSRLPAISRLIIKSKEKEILQYFKIKAEHTAINAVTPKAPSASQEVSFKVWFI